jgi:hypothetical protein
MTPRGADEHFEALVRRGFIVVVRTRRDGSRVIRYAPGAAEWFEAAALYTRPTTPTR